MRHPPDTLSRAVASQSESARPGLFRQEVLGTERALTVTNLFSDLRRLNRGEIIAEHRERHLQGTRLVVDPSHGHGFWELYRLDRDLYVVAVDGVYDTGRVETVPGEGLVEFCIRLSGVLELSIPGCAGTVRVAGPQLLVWYQPPDVTVTESLRPRCGSRASVCIASPHFFGAWWSAMELASGRCSSKSTIIAGVRPFFACSTCRPLSYMSRRAYWNAPIVEQSGYCMRKRRRSNFCVKYSRRRRNHKV